MLIDVHLRENNGIELLQFIRNSHLPIEIIMITAAKEKDLIEQALQYGILDYLIKPFKSDRLKQSINVFLEKMKWKEQKILEQGDLDQLLLRAKSSPKQNDKKEELEKGISRETYEQLLSIISKKKNLFTVNDLTQEIALSHVSIRKYLSFLEQQGYIQAETKYLKVGRPIRCYRRTSRLP